MAEHPCFEGLAENFPDFPKDEIRQMLNELEEEKEAATTKNLAFHDALIEAGDRIFQDKEAQADLKKFRFWRNVEVKNKQLLRLAEFRGMNDGLRKGLKSAIVGTERNIKSARESTQIKQRFMQGKVQESLLNEIEDAGLSPLFNSDEHEEALLKELGDVSQDNPQVKELAQIIKKHRDQMDRDLKRNGVFIEELDRRGVRNFHTQDLLRQTSDSFKERLRDIRTLTDTEKFDKALEHWKQTIHPNPQDTLIDWKRTVGEENPTAARQDKFLREAFTTLTNGLKFTDQGMSMVQRLGARRVIHFKDEAAKVKYNKKFGVGSIQEAVRREFESYAQYLPVMEDWGDNPTAMLKKVRKAAEEFPEFRGTFSKGRKFSQIQGWMDGILGGLNDSTSSLATIGSNVRAFINITKLGKVLLISLTDMAPISQETARIHGSYSSAMTKALLNLVPGERKAINKLIAKQMNIYTHQVVGNATRWFSSGDMPSGMMSKLMRLQFKWSGMKGWDFSHRAGIAADLASWVADHRDVSFADLDKRGQFGRVNRQIFEQYGIDSDLWDLIRSAPVSDIKGRKFITSDALTHLDDSDIRAFAFAKGIDQRKMTPSRIQDIKDEAQRKLGMYYADRVDHGILMPGEADRQIWLGNTKAGTKEGEFLRSMAQFKMYGTTFVTKPLARTLYGPVADNFINRSLGGKVDVTGLAQLIGYATMLGYAGNALSDIAENKTPMSPFSEVAFTRALSSGGGLGIYSDYLFNDPNSYNGGIVKQLLGPSIAEAAQGYNLAAGLFHGSTTTNQAFHFIKGNIPFANLFYAKNMLDALIFNHMQETVSPGYFKRKLSELRKNNQNFLFNPLQ